ncbi:DUF6907 domain-containing protein [Streptomyces sp. NPDC001530]|uniref:DUF6907 domain-containing protein n=1 Tax=Streptomyces sp. NPDC001530 TaxID=3364582 RepID=UPI0036A52AE8
MAATASARLVPALINGRTVRIECLPWCVTDHVAESERSLEDVAHAGALTDLVVPGGEPGLRLLAHVRLGADSYAPDPADQDPFLVVSDGSESHHLNPKQAGQFADNLIAFAEQVRSLAHAITEVAS